MTVALLLAAALCAPAAARAWPDCLHVGAKKTPPRTFAELRACQKQAARRLADRAEAKGKPLSDADRDALAEHQRVEARKFLARPGAVVAGPPGPAPAEGKNADAPNSGEDDGRPAGPGMDANSAELGPAIAHVQQRFAAAGIDEVPQDAAARLRPALEATGGRVTPEIEGMIDDAIKAAQGAAPPDESEHRSSPP